MKTKIRKTAEIAKLIGVSKDTVLRWLKQEQIKEPHRDKRGWRVFSDSETLAIQEYALLQGSSRGIASEAAATFVDVADVPGHNGASLDSREQVSFSVQILSRIYRQANDLMRNIDGLQPQEAFDELLKYISLKETLEKHHLDLSSPFALFGSTDEFQPREELVERLRSLFAVHLHEMGHGAAELWKDGRFRLTDKCLLGLHDLFQPLQFSSIPFDLRSAALREFLSPLTRKALGIFLTPDEVAKMMVGVIAPQPGHRVCDPACGSATFLIEVLKLWQRQSGYVNKTTPLIVYGIDKNPRMLLLAELNLHHAARCVFRSELADSLTAHTIKPNTCNAIFTNPPFGVNVDSRTIDLSAFESAKNIVSGGLRRIPSEVLFLELCLRCLVPGGALAILLPRSVVTNGTLDAARRVFDKLGYVYAIVSLPSETFQAAGTQTTTVVVFVKKYSDGEDRDKPVRICIGNVTNVGFDSTGRKRTDSELPGLVENIKNCLSLQKPVGCCILSTPLVKEETFSRLPELLANRVSKKNALKLGAILTQVSCGRTPPRASYTPKGLFVVKVGNLTGNGIDWSPRDRNFVDPDVYLANQKNENRYLRSGDILLTSSAHTPVYIAKKVDIVAEIPSEVGGTASFVGEVMRLRVDSSKVDPYILLVYLRLPSVMNEIQAMIRGQTAHLYPDDVLNLPVNLDLLKPNQILLKLADLARLEARKFSELNRIMFDQAKLSAELAD